MNPALANHLLQSTVFAGIAGVLTLLLRNNHARMRYWLWFGASMKFFIPFEWFVKLGHGLGPSLPTVAASPKIYFVAQEISQPFLVSAVPAAPAQSIVPSLVLAIWVCGAIAVLIFWITRWIRVADALRRATPLIEGREFQSMRRAAARRQARLPVPRLISSTSSVEPGVFGILRPVLSLPAGIADRLDDGQLDAIVAHELCHVRRRDNLTSALHMLVEAAFWFHPLVWWIGARLVEERERACDEEVVGQGGDPEVYAESILKICRYYLATPLPCAAGISGSDLKNRIESIMADASLASLSAAKKIILSVAGLLAILTPIALGVAAQSPHLQFETIAIKPAPLGPLGRTGGPEQISYQSVALGALIQEAYAITEDRITAPGWVYLENYSFSAKIPPGTTPEQFRTMLQIFLSERFHLTVHHATRDTAGYELVVGRNGTKLKDSASVPNASLRRVKRPDDAHDIVIDKDGFPDLGNFKGMSVVDVNGRSMESCQSCPVKTLVGRLAQAMGTRSPGDRLGPRITPALVVDKTGLTGEYDFKLASSSRTENDSDVREAIEQQLGLELKAVDHMPVDLLVVDHVERLSSQEGK